MFKQWRMAVTAALVAVVSVALPVLGGAMDIRSSGGGAVSGTTGSFSGTITSTVASTVDALLMTNEAEIQWPDTKIAEVGTNLVFTGGISTNVGFLITNTAASGSGFNIASADPFLYGSNSNSTLSINTECSAANCGATDATAHVSIYPGQVLDATDYVLSVADSTRTSKFWVTYAGKTGITGNSTTCTLNAGSPSTCTATVSSGAVCLCTPVGGTAAIAAGGCAVGLSGTTLTATSANGLNNVVNIICDR